MITVQFTDQELTEIRQYVNRSAGMNARNISDKEFSWLIHMCERLGLLPPPLGNQINAIMRSDAYRAEPTHQGFIALAHRTRELVGIDPIRIEWEDPERTRVFSATATVYRFLAGKPRAFSATVLFREFYKGVNSTKKGGKNAMWDDIPAQMISVRALSHAIRLAFENEVNGLYTSEEMGAEVEVEEEGEQQQPIDFEKARQGVVQPAAQAPQSAPQTEPEGAAQPAPQPASGVEAQQEHVKQHLAVINAAQNTAVNLILATHKAESKETAIRVLDAHFADRGEMTVAAYVQAMSLEHLQALIAYWESWVAEDKRAQLKASMRVVEEQPALFEEAEPVAPTTTVAPPSVMCSPEQERRIGMLMKQLAGLYRDVAILDDEGAHRDQDGGLLRAVNPANPNDPQPAFKAVMQLLFNVKAWDASVLVDGHKQTFFDVATEGEAHAGIQQLEALISAYDESEDYDLRTALATYKEVHAA